MPTIVDLASRAVYNSHARPTVEFELRLKDGRSGAAAPSQGETVGVHEDHRPPGLTRLEPQIRETLLGHDFTQESLDALLDEHVESWGRNTCSAVSEAFYYATDRETLAGQQGALPRVCVNLFNGGEHAYTNPVLSDFPEFLVLTDSDDPLRWMPVHEQLQATARQRLQGLEQTEVNGNPVHRVGTGTTIDVLLLMGEILASVPGAEAWELMVDASAGDLWQDGTYHLGITGQGSFTSAELVDAWVEIVRGTGLRYLEDPFQESDHAAWRELRRRLAGECAVIGDNYTSTDATRIAHLAGSDCIDGAIIKPNQAGSVTRSIAAVDSCIAEGVVPITSHRSISVESTFLADLTVARSVPLIKVGPLQTDYSSVLRLNQMLRLGGQR